jgi:hypothetical protein
MKLISWMLAGSVVCSFAIAALLGAQTGLAVWFGMMGPLTMAAVTQLMVERVYMRHPEHLTSLAMKAFLARMVFFAVYMTVVLGFGGVRPIPFAISFTGYFLALLVIEAIGLYRLRENIGKELQRMIPEDDALLAAVQEHGAEEGDLQRF